MQRAVAYASALLRSSSSKNLSDFIYSQKSNASKNVGAVRFKLVKMLVMGIDIGLVNLAYAWLDTVTKEVYVDKISLIEKYKYKECIIPFLVQEFIEPRRKLFEQCKLVVIESQMK